MRFYKMASDGYIAAVGTGGVTGEEITEKEYAEIKNIIVNAPTAPDGYTYALTDSLQWELIKAETPDVIDTMTETEQKAAAYDILTGVIE